jgi:hypothetical protein
LGLSISVLATSAIGFFSNTLAVQTTTTPVVNDLTAENGQNQSQISAVPISTTLLVSVFTAQNRPLCYVAGSGFLQANYETQNFSVCIYDYNQNIYYLGIDKRDGSYIQLPAYYDLDTEGYVAVNRNVEYRVNDSNLCIKGVAKKTLCFKVLSFKDYQQIH